MKSHYMVEQFFHPRFRPELGATLALLRIAAAYALTKSALCLHVQMPDALARLKVQVVPFLEAFATAWSFSFWHTALIVAGVALGIGFFTRAAALFFLLFFMGVVVVDYHALFTCLGPWSGVAILTLFVALFSRWGHVVGIDELIKRFGLFERKGKGRGFLG